MKFNPFSQSLELFGEGSALEGLIPCRVLRQCLWGERGSPCLGSIPMCAQRPCSAHNPPLAHTGLSQINDCLLGNADFRPAPPARGDSRATPELLVSQSAMRFSFLQSLPGHSHVGFGKLQSLNAHSRAGTELWAMPVEQEIPNPVGHTLPGDLAHTFGLVFNSSTF